MNRNLVGEDLCCSFCGSLNPDRVIDLIKQYGFSIINPSTKSYKWYVERLHIPNASFGGIKYYRWHDDEKFIKDYNDLVTLQRNNVFISK